MTSENERHYVKDELKSINLHSNTDQLAISKWMMNTFRFGLYYSWEELWIKKSKKVCCKFIVAVISWSQESKTKSLKLQGQAEFEMQVTGTKYLTQVQVK
jgi:hypothetical protein